MNRLQVFNHPWVFLGVILSLAIAAHNMQGAITFSDKNATGGGGSTSTNLVFTNNAAAPCAIVAYTATEDAVVADQSVTSVAAGSTNFNFRVQATNTSSDRVTMWTCTNTPTGVFTITYTFGGNCQVFAVGAASFSGVQLTDQPDSTNGMTLGSSTHPTITNTTVNANCVIVDVINKITQTGTIDSADTGQTILVNADISLFDIAASYEVVGAAGENVQGYTFSTGTASAYACLALIPEPEVAAGVTNIFNTHGLLLRGVGP